MRGSVEGKRKPGLIFQLGMTVARPDDREISGGEGHSWKGRVMEGLTNGYRVKPR